MNIWRLVPHHIYPKDMAQWNCREGVIALGWGWTGSLDNLVFDSEADVKQIVQDRHPGITNAANAARSLWHLYHDMQPGDTVILSASGARVAAMRVIGEYYFVSGDPQNSYEHRRKAEMVSVDTNRLWHAAGKAAPGERVYAALVRCARRLSEAEFAALAD